MTFLASAPEPLDGNAYAAKSADTGMASWTGSHESTAPGRPARGCRVAIEPPEAEQAHRDAPEDASDNISEVRAFTNPTRARDADLAHLC